MLAIQLRFPGGRYHATPWDHHVNEGIVEWPPSPWRLLRALIAVWHRKAQVDVEESSLRRVVEALSSSLPEYSLPPAIAAHTRHYMPLFNGNTTKVFDTFLHVDPDSKVHIIWRNLELEETDQMALEILLDRLSYLGRAESWVIGQIDRNPPPPNTVLLAKVGEFIDAEPLGELVRVLAPVPDSSYLQWRAGALDEITTRRLVAERMKKGATVKLSISIRRKLDASLPEDLFAALHLDTSDVRSEGWSRIPGAQWIEYRRATPLGTRNQARAPGRQVQEPTVVRYAVASKIAPSFTKLLRFSDVVRKTLLYHSDGHVAFSGKDSDLTPEAGHQHLHVFPESNDGSGGITHVSLYVASGFDTSALEAAMKMRKLYYGSEFEAQLV